MRFALTMVVVAAAFCLLSISLHLSDLAHSAQKLAIEAEELRHSVYQLGADVKSLREARR